jgi:hypothetical protein
MKQPVPSVREHAPGVSAEVEAVVRGALAKRPEERPDSRGLARQLSAAVGLPAGEETAAAANPPAPTPAVPSAPSAPSGGPDPSGTSVPGSKPAEIDATLAVEVGSERSGAGLGGLLRRLRGRRTDR